MKKNQSGFKNLTFFVVPAMAWGLGIFLRDSVITPICATFPSQCKPSLIPWPDRLFFGPVWMPADWISYVTQDLAIVLPLALLLLWRVERVLLRPALENLALTILCNGALTEWTRILVNRPRPFVYKDPHEFGESLAHYTSFYSGHTSFTAAVSTQVAILSMTILRERLTHAQRGILLFSGAFLTLTTAILRVVSERHFFTDVVAAILAGMCTAWMVFEAKNLIRTATAPGAQGR